MNNWQDRITADPKIMFGKPCIRGTRIPVDLIVEKIGFGESYDQLLEAYPRISVADIQACLLFAAESVRSVMMVEA